MVFDSNTHSKFEKSLKILKTCSNFWCCGVNNKHPTSPQRDVCYKIFHGVYFLKKIAEVVVMIAVMPISCFHFYILSQSNLYTLESESEETKFSKYGTSNRQRDRLEDGCADHPPVFPVRGPGDLQEQGHHQVLLNHQHHLHHQLSSNRETVTAMY